MPHRQHRNPVDLLESALQGALDDTNFPVRTERHRDDSDDVSQPAQNPLLLTPEERDRLAFVPGERRSI
jgi:hypothetical protein